MILEIGGSMRQYLDLLKDIRDNGEEKGDRTGTGTKSVFGRQVRYDLSEGFPAVTTKKLYFNSVVHELLWFLKGTGNIEYLAQNNVHIWDEWPFKAYLEKNDLPIPEVNSPEWKDQMRDFIPPSENPGLSSPGMNDTTSTERALALA